LALNGRKIVKIYPKVDCEVGCQREFNPRSTLLVFIYGRQYPPSTMISAPVKSVSLISESHQDEVPVV
jgi:hypothetical protein